MKKQYFRPITGVCHIESAILCASGVPGTEGVLPIIQKSSGSW